MDMPKLDRSIFDQPLDRRGTGSIKWDQIDKKFGNKDVLPLWIADMDFAIPQAVSEALKARLEHPLFGYHFRSPDYINSIVNWLETRFEWRVAKHHLRFYPPGTVAAINNLVQLFTESQDEIIVHTPAYPPLMNIVKQNNRQLVTSQLKTTKSGFEIDWPAFERCFTQKTKMLILCSPHNPTGRVWRKSELERIAQICQKHQVMVVSDEVHADLVAPETRHTHFNRLEKSKRPSSVTIISSCKTFNLAGLSQATMIVDDKALADKIQWSINTQQLNLDNVMSAVATTTAYQKGSDWLDALNVYIQENRNYLVKTLKSSLPLIRVAPAQGTYLAWLDFSGLNMTHEQVMQKLIQDAKVGLYDGRLFDVSEQNAGETFCNSGEHYFRINLACPKAFLQKAIRQIIEAFA